MQKINREDFNSVPSTSDENDFFYGKLPNIIQTILDTGKPPAVTGADRNGSYKSPYMENESIFQKPSSDATIDSYISYEDNARVCTQNLATEVPIDPLEQFKQSIKSEYLNQEPSKNTESPIHNPSKLANENVKLAQEMDETISGIIKELAHNDTLSEGQRIALLTKYVTMCQTILNERFGVTL